MLPARPTVFSWTDPAENTLASANTTDRDALASLRREMTWMAIAVSVTVGFVVYLLVTWRSSRRASDDASALGGSSPATSWPSLSSWITPKPDRSLAAGSQRQTNYQTVLRTLAVSPGEPVLIFEAVGDQQNWRVQVRCIGPGGSTAIVGTDPGAVRGTGSPAGSSVALVPAGTFVDLPLYPRQKLYVRGDTSNTLITLTAGIAP